MAIQKMKFTCKTIPEIKEWEDSVYTSANKIENRIKLIVDDTENTSVTMLRLLKIIKVPLKKEVKISFYGLLGEIKSAKIYDPETCFAEGEINYTRKTCKLKTQGGRFKRWSFTE
jgi:hypothetical protein